MPLHAESGKGDGFVTIYPTPGSGRRLGIVVADYRLKVDNVSVASDKVSSVLCHG
jgi:hypothetical protein